MNFILIIELILSDFKTFNSKFLMQKYDELD